MTNRISAMLAAIAFACLLSMPGSAQQQPKTKSNAKDLLPLTCAHLPLPSELLVTMPSAAFLPPFGTTKWKFGYGFPTSTYGEPDTAPLFRAASASVLHRDCR